MIQWRLRRVAAIFLIALLELQPLMASAAASFQPGTCQYVSGPNCIDQTHCKTMNGTTVCLQGVPIAMGSGIARIPETCWQYESNYTCLDEASYDDCKYYRDKGCGQVGSTCTYKTPTGICTVFEQTFQCQLTAPTTKTSLDCSGATICSNGNCWATPGVDNSRDFASAVTAMEVARQASVYKNCDANGNCTFFKGVGEQCNEGWFGSGLGNCCKTSGVQPNDHSVLKSAGMSFATSAGIAGAQEAGNMVAQWTWTSLYSANPEMMAQLFSSTTAYGMGMDAANGSLFGGATFGAFGFSVGTASAGAGGLTSGGTMVLYDFTASSGAMAGEAVGSYATGAASGTAAGGNTVLMFNPYVFAAIVAYMVIMEMSKCTQDEMVLSLHRGSNLCVQADRWCSQEIPLLGCARYSQSYCCYNSLLAKAINVGGRAQLGRPVGGGKGSPDCSGLSVDEMSRIDFSRIDFSEFVSSVSQGAYGAAPSSAQQDAMNSTIQNTMANRCPNGATPDSTGHCPTVP